MTKNFMQFLMDMDIKNEQGRLRIRDMNSDDAVFDGRKIFDIFFEGTNYKNYAQYNGPEDF